MKAISFCSFVGERSGRIVLKPVILYEDSEVLVCVKPVGIESQTSRSFEPDMVSVIRNHLRENGDKNGEPYVGVIHRLDKPVGGVMVYAKGMQSSKALCNQVQNKKMVKKYYAVLCGQPVDNSGQLVDYLWKETGKNTSKVVDSNKDGGKQARLSYRILGTKEKEGNILSLAEITLETGRHHQIRVQFSNAGFPLWGDNRYNENFVSGRKRGSIALYAFHLGFFHPQSGKWMEFENRPESSEFQNFQNFTE